MPANKKLSEAALRILGALDVTRNTHGTVAKITGGQLERKLYDEVNKALEALGGKWNRSAKGHVFGSPEGLEEALETVLHTGTFVDMKKLTQFYATPPELADALVAAADIRKGMTVLEPSAGGGALLDAIDRLNIGENQNPNMLHVAWVESDAARANKLHIAEKSCKVWGFSSAGFTADFLKHVEVAQQAGVSFDRVVMNPPFTQQQDAKHVLAAYALLKRGGVLAAIMSAAVKFRQTKLYDQVRALNPNITDNPPGSFKAAGTNVHTVMVVIHKP